MLVKKNITIGLLATEIDGNFESLYWNSVKNAANKFDCNLIAFEGRELDSIYPSKKQHNIIYNLVGKNRLDGIIVSSGTLIEYIGCEGLSNFLKQFKSIPMVCIGQMISGITSILVDNRQGMRNLVEHIIKDHGHKRIAFLKGPTFNSEADERFKAYIEVLNENNIKIDDNIIFEGDFRSDTGYRIMKDIIRNNINFETLVCANDEMAIGVLKASKELKLKVPDDFAICGFDSTINACIMSLTTVRQPIDEIAEKAVDLLLKKIGNEPVNDIEIFPATPVKRKSCGCTCENNGLDSFPDGNLKIMRHYKVHENMQTYSLDELFNQITGALKEFSIRSCFIVKYSESTEFSGMPSVLPENSELIYAYYNNRRIDTDSKPVSFNTGDIIPDKYIPIDRRFTYLVNPLFFKNEHFGFVVFEVEYDDVVYYEALRGQISNTLKGAILMIEREKMKENLIERERLVSLGHLIGGISHNFNTPIMSISGVCIGFEDLVKELRESIGDPSVTQKDHEDIANEMSSWLEKLKSHISYISNTINEVRRQAVQLNASINKEFKIEELLSGISILLKNNLKIRCGTLNLNVDIDPRTTIKGEMSNLIQVINNLIINAFQSYDGLGDSTRIIELDITQDKYSILFAVKDYGIGITDSIKNKLFKQMVTTKGKNGTGLSLLLSYSTILGKFGGKIWFETALNHGSTFYISIPLLQSQEIKSKTDKIEN